MTEYAVSGTNNLEVNGVTSPSIPVGNGRLAILKPIFQYGFAGFAALLLVVICWRMYCGDQQFRDLIQLQAQTNTVIERNTTAIRELSRIVMDKL